MALFEQLEQALELDEQEIITGGDSPATSSKASADPEVKALIAAEEDSATEQTVKQDEAKIIHEDGSADRLPEESIKE